MNKNICEVVMIKLHWN